MNKNNIIGILSLFFVFIFVFSSCYKEERWTEENVEVLGYIPMITDFSTSKSTVKSGDKMDLDLRFWCKDPIKEIRFLPNLNGVDLDSLVFPYSPAYSEITRTDSLVVFYDVPAVDSTSTLIINAKVVAENGQVRVTEPKEAWWRIIINPVTVTVEP